MKYLALSFIISLCFITNAQAIKVGKGRISLIELDSNISSEPTIAQKELINVFSLSADIDREKKTVLAIQGLQDQGETSFFVDTAFGAQNIIVQLDKTSSETESRKPGLTKIKSLSQIFNLKINSSLRVTSPYYLNDYVLAGDPELFNLDPFSDYYDENYLKNFILNAKDIRAKTDIVVPTTRKIFKFTIEVDQFKGAYNNVINLI